MIATDTVVGIVGAGPVGLFTSYLLARAGVKVAVFESEEGISQSPRAIAYLPVVLEEFGKAGILDDVSEVGYKNITGVDWRDGKGKVLAGIQPPPGSFAIQLGQPELAAIILKRLRETGNAEVKFGYRFTSADQTDESVTAHFEVGPDKTPYHLKIRYLVGADGGRSSVRTSLGVHMEGFTWESLRLIAANIVYDLNRFGWKSANFVVDPLDWAVVAKLGKGHNWRYATGERMEPGSINKLEFDREATIKRLREQYRRTLPGNVDEIQFRNIAQYVVHQRCASTFIKGNILLAGDAAHLNNPIGGLGLTTGLLDAAHLASALQKVILENKPTSLLQEYADARHRIFSENTSPTSTANLNRLMSEKPEHVEERKTFLDRLNAPVDFEFLKAEAEREYRLSTTREV